MSPNYLPIQTEQAKPWIKHLLETGFKCFFFFDMFVFIFCLLVNVQWAFPTFWCTPTWTRIEMKKKIYFYQIKFLRVLGHLDWRHQRTLWCGQMTLPSGDLSSGYSYSLFGSKIKQVSWQSCTNLQSVLFTDWTSMLKETTNSRLKLFCWSILTSC